jgi:hypothetical protein
LLLSDFTARGAVIKAFVSILIVIFFYLRNLLPKKFLGFIHHLAMLLPIVLFSLASLGIFNPLDMNKLVEKQLLVKREKMDGTIIDEDLRIDTRTFLYKEVLSSAIKNEYVIFGRTPARGNETKYFKSLSKITGRAERLSNEAGILNVFTWTGLIGVLLYFFMFYHASFLAINKSNNFFSKLLGLMLTFRWMYSWISDENQFHLMDFSIFLLMVLCYSIQFRRMSNKEVFFWIRGVFSANYRKYWITNFYKNKLYYK